VPWRVHGWGKGLPITKSRWNEECLPNFRLIAQSETPPFDGDNPECPRFRSAPQNKINTKQPQFVCLTSLNSLTKYQMRETTKLINDSPSSHLSKILVFVAYSIYFPWNIFLILIAFFFSFEVNGNIPKNQLKHKYLFLINSKMWFHRWLLQWITFLSLYFRGICSWFQNYMHINYRFYDLGEIDFFIGNFYSTKWKL